MTASQKFVERTKQVWQLYAPDALSDEDAKEITDNMVALFSFLLELDKKYGCMAHPAKPASEPFDMGTGITTDRPLERQPAMQEE